MKNIVRKIFTVLTVCMLLLSLSSVIAFATDGEEEIAERSVFGQLYDATLSHSAEILSALTLVGSCVLAFSYKNGLLPTFKKGIGGIGSAVTEIKESTERTVKAAEEVSEAARGGISELGQSLDGVKTGLSGIAERIESLERDEVERRKLEAVINEQVSLLYDIFMFSSMPEYQKEAVTRRMEKLRALIKEGDGKNDEGKEQI